MTPFSWNIDRELILPDQYRSQVGIGWRNYLDTEWKTINTDVRSDKTITAFPGNVSFPSSSQGWSNIVLDHKFSIKRTIDVGNNNNYEPELSIDLQVLTQHNVTGHIDNNWMVYLNAWDTADLMLGVELGRAARIKKIVKINSMPSGSGDVEYQFNLRSSDAKVFAGPNFDIRPWTGSVGDSANVTSSVFIAKEDSPLRGALLKTPKCWWFDNGNKVEHDITVAFTIQSDGETVLGTKYIPRTYITQALAAGSSLYTDATFTPDASPETTTFDGLTLLANNSLSWSGLIGTANGQFLYDSDATTEFRVWAKNTTNNWDVLARAHFLFDTSSIGGGQQVDTASIDLSVDKVYFDEFDFYAKFYATNPASNTGIAAADHDTVGTTAFSDGIKITDMSTDWTTETWTLTSDGREAVDMEGISKFGLAVNYDRENGTTGDPTWVINDRSGFVIRFSDNGSNTPTLDVTHSAAGPAMPILIRHYDNMRAK